MNGTVGPIFNENVLKKLLNNTLVCTVHKQKVKKHNY